MVRGATSRSWSLSISYESHSTNAAFGSHGMRRRVARSGTSRKSAHPLSALDAGSSSGTMSMSTAKTNVLAHTPDPSIASLTKDGTFSRLPMMRPAGSGAPHTTVSISPRSASSSSSS
ncbi:unannotated protein [freshwater metagenome]|uniref:Unannotated protein n=1 Tax=freshwater metagenome TaxID=449393 RepID=A0A6J7K202_9ZZZZ